MKLNIATKTLAGYLAVILLLVVVAFLGVQELNKVAAAYQDLTNRTDNMLVQARRLEAAEFAKSRASFGYLLTQNPQFKTDADTAVKEASESLAKLKALARADEAKAAIAEGEETNKAFDAVVVPIFSQAVFSPEQINDLAVNKLPPARTKVTAATQKLTAFLEKYNQDAQSAATAEENRSRMLITLISALAAVLGIGIGILFSRSISRPVVAVAGVAKRLAEGDLTMNDLRVSTRDEVGEMAGSINHMVSTLRDVLQQISLSAQTVTSASEELTAASEAAAQAAQGSSQAISQVAAGAGEQSQATAQVNVTVEQLRATIEQIATGATKSAAEAQEAALLLTDMASALDGMLTDAAATAQGAEQAALAARDGAGVVERTLEEIGQIRVVVVQSSDRIKDLERLSGRIGAITEVISGIADQTNLLALNAAIEAARAGEHGRGFAVVADEVRKLAERAAASTREIADLVTGIQNGTAEAVKEMEIGTQRVEAGSQLAAEAGQSLKEIVAAAQSTAASMGRILDSATRAKAGTAQVVQAFDAVAALTEENTAATEEMAAGATEVTRAVDRISHVSQDNAAGAEEVSAAVEELSASSEEVASSAQSLARTAQELQEQVLRFRL
jgi:methyl-accepting chemotaxis protein